jgi:hypothetical protein
MDEKYPEKIVTGVKILKKKSHIKDTSKIYSDVGVRVSRSNI